MVAISKSERWMRMPGTVLALILAVAVVVPAGAADGAPSAFIAALGDKAVRILRADGQTLAQREAGLRKLLQEDFDLDLLSRFALGRYWRRATPEQRRDYQMLFSEYVLRTYSARLGGYAGEKLVIVSEQALGNKRDTLVNTRIDRPSGPPIKAAWRVRSSSQGMRIIDVMVEGVSMAVTQRDTFAAVVQRSGVEGLIEVLRARTDRAAATNS